ncbi:MAG TPA: tetratricopeptide repeat protein [Streptosporangiaceae bacterium]|nr:tetratricopeptide repeat protein [Streptosporangiaceae bacterium]
MAAQREPNERLRTLLAEARWTGQGLARAVNAIGAESGRRLRYTRASVAHWLAGVRPRSPVPELIAEAFSRRLGRPITVRAVGLAEPDESPASGAARWTTAPVAATAADIAGALAELGSADADPARRAELRGAVYTLALPPPPRGAARRQGRVEAAAAATGPSDWPGQVEAAAWVANFFSDADAAFGGGHARSALAAYLASDIAPRLRPAGAPATHGRMLAAAANLTYLCGFMCFDDTMHGAAQRYYAIALRLAAAAEDRQAYGVVLRAMSVQAHYLGHHVHALHLAEAAVTGGSRAARPATRAFLLGQLAVARAGVGDRGALADMRAAERALDRRDSTSDVIGAYHRAALDHQRAEMLVALGDRTGAIAALTSSLRHRPRTERRARTITLARLAGLQLDHGHLEAAVETWHRFLDDYPYLRCGRADAALATLRARIRPYRGNVAAGTLWRRAASPPEPPPGL